MLLGLTSRLAQDEFNVFFRKTQIGFARDFDLDGGCLFALLEADRPRLLIPVIFVEAEVEVDAGSLETLAEITQFARRHVTVERCFPVDITVAFRRAF